MSFSDGHSSLRGVQPWNGNSPALVAASAEKARNRASAPARIQPLTAPDREDPDWRSRAACRNEDPELFFPVGNTGPALLQIEDAKSVCRRCDVAGQCLQWALESGQDAGVWGGMSEDERRALKRKASRARSRTS